MSKVFRSHSKVPPIKSYPRFDVQTYVRNVLDKDTYIPLFEKAVLGIDEDVKLKVVSKFGRRASLTYEKLPFEILCESYVTMPQGGTWFAEIQIQTTVDDGVNGFRLHPKAYLTDLLCNLRLMKTIQLDDEEFSDRFVVRGHEGGARRALTNSVRAELLMISKQDIPKVVVTKGLARIAWTFEPSEEMLRAALSALKGIREALSEAGGS